MSEHLKEIKQIECVTSTWMLDERHILAPHRGKNNRKMSKYPKKKY